MAASAEGIWELAMCWASQCCQVYVKWSMKHSITPLKADDVNIKVLRVGLSNAISDMTLVIVNDTFQFFPS